MSDEVTRAAIKSITIIDTTIPILEYKGQRVITLATMDKIHRRPEGTATIRFNDNKERLVEGKHFFYLNFQEVSSLSEFRRAGVVPNSQGLVVLTERGYSILVKSFTDDFAWEVQDQLVDSYFDNKKPMSTAEFLVQQAQLILEHENRIKRLEHRQDSTEVHLAETRHEVELMHQKADKAFEVVAAVINYKAWGIGLLQHYWLL
ncbi:MAG: ORF6N domain-containing protein [Nitrospirae bacterium]|nr:ORF6N domain-containing protein [Nitrospirota bacterium]